MSFCESQISDEWVSSLSANWVVYIDALSALCTYHFALIRCVSFLSIVEFVKFTISRVCEEEDEALGICGMRLGSFGEQIAV